MNVINFRWQYATLLVIGFVFVIYSLTHSSSKQRLQTRELELSRTTHKVCPTCPPVVNIKSDQIGQDRIGPLSDHILNEVKETVRPTIKPKIRFPLDSLSPGDILDPNLAPNTVFYIWCGKRWFEFHHYLSVLSVMRYIRPDNLIFYHDIEPVLDSWLYNTWMKELRRDYPFIRFRKLSDQEKGCDGMKSPNDDFIDNRLKHYGGLYVNEYTILTRFPLESRRMSFLQGVDTNEMNMFELRQKGGTRNYELVNVDKLSSRIRCPSIESYIAKQDLHPMCIRAKEVFYPKDIWELNNKFGKLVRTIFYGSPEIKEPFHSSDTLIPNIAHMVWLGRGEMDYLFYLSVLSLLYVAEVDNLYIHGDGPPTGRVLNLSSL